MVNIVTVFRTARRFLFLAVLFFALHASFAWSAEPLTPPASLSEAMAAALAASGPDTAMENGWQAFIAAHALVPQRIVAVDKNRQLLFLFERKSPLRIAEQYVCTTGRAVGDKLESGDLKTPEGVYFVVRRLDSGLDYIKYGNEAYTLNYPNPVDKLRRKTGYGIWIHGRGEPIQPRVTEGCVSLNNGDIAVLGRNLEPGAPVTLASSVVHAQDYPAQDMQTIQMLERKSYEWAEAWGSRSASMFDFYDQEAYGIAQSEPFSAFRAQKERLFTMLPWIENSIRDVHVLPGPGYWVTWFYQDYKAPNLSTQGVRRLYWQPDSSGEFRIVGMEWLPNLSGALLASRGDFVPGAALADAGPGSGTGAESGDASQVPVPEGGQGTLAAGQTPLAVASAPEAAPAVADPAAPAGPSEARAEAQDPPLPVADTPPALATPDPVQLAEAAPAAPSLPGPPADPAPSPAPAPALSPAEELAAQGARFVERWRNAWENGDLDAYIAYYAPDAVQGKRTGAAAIEAHKRASWKKKPPLHVGLSNMRISVSGDTITADMLQEYEDSSGYRDVGIKTLIIRRSGSSLVIVQEDWVAETP